MDRLCGEPLPVSTASITIIAKNCMLADAWAATLMVRKRVEGSKLACKMGLDALFIERNGEYLIQMPIRSLLNNM